MYCTYTLSFLPLKNGKNNQTSSGDAMLIDRRISQSDVGSEYSQVGHSLHVDGQVCSLLSRNNVPHDS